jgi:hypothetical protein
MTGREDGLSTYIQDARHQFEEMLAEMVQIPSVSMDPRHATDMPRMAALAVQFLRGMAPTRKSCEPKAIRSCRVAG